MIEATQLQFLFEEQKATSLTDRWSGLLPQGIMEIFESMELAEGVIKEMQEKHPDQSAQIFKTFILLRPAFPMTKKLYQLHCKEIIERVITSKDTRPATKAEFLQFFSDCSQKAPLINDAATVMWHLFLELFGEATYKKYLYDMPEPRFTYQGAGDDILHKLRNGLKSDWRKP